jgi:hypothetical protein
MNNEDHNYKTIETTLISVLDRPTEEQNLIENNIVLNQSKYILFKVLLTAIIISIGSSSIVLLSLGKTVTNWTRCTGCLPEPWPECTNCDSDHYKDDCNPSKCDDLGCITIVMALVLALSFWQFPPYRCKYHIFCCGDFTKKIKWKPYLTMLIMYLVAVGLVLLAHGIGYGINMSLFKIDEFFTWRTSLTGFTLYAILAFGLFAIAICVECGK